MIGREELEAVADRLEARVAELEELVEQAELDTERKVTVEMRARLDAATEEIERYRRSLVAHHDLATLSDGVIREYDFRSCPVCARAHGA